VPAVIRKEEHLDARCLDACCKKGLDQTRCLRRGLKNQNHIIRYGHPHVRRHQERRSSLGREECAPVRLECCARCRPEECGRVGSQRRFRGGAWCRSGLAGGWGCGFRP
jgi:hypothetical protein